MLPLPLMLCPTPVDTGEVGVEEGRVAPLVLGARLLEGGHIAVEADERSARRRKIPVGTDGNLDQTLPHHHQQREHIWLPPPQQGHQGPSSDVGAMMNCPVSVLGSSTLSVTDVALIG